MIRLQFFARYREHLGQAEDFLDWQSGWASIEDVRRQLVARGGAWQVLAESNLMCARNQELCSTAEALADGDELAFFPPVTGG